MINSGVFALLIGIAVLCLFSAVWRLAPRRDPITVRLDDYGGDEPKVGNAAAQGQKRVRFRFVQQALDGFGLGSRLSRALSQADMPMTAAEFILTTLAMAAAGFMLGLLRINLLAGVGFAIFFGLMPYFYLRMRRSRRKRALTEQLPDMLTLLVGALRVGYGLNQALAVLVERMPPPTSAEMARVLRAVKLGVPVQQALNDMAARLDSDDMDLVVTAINVQYEMGGNLALILETISQTVRERIRLLREVRVLTAQQRMSGYILALIPVILIVAFSLLRPGYFQPFFEPGPLRLLPLVAVCMMAVGFVLIQRIVDIDV